MNITGAVLAIIYFFAGLAGAVALGAANGASFLMALVLWISFFGFSMLVACMIVWSREHWLG